MQNLTGSTNKVSKNHFMPEGADKTLCGVEVTSIKAVTRMDEQAGSGKCKRCANTKTAY